MNIDKDIERVKNIKYISISGHFYGQFMRAEIPEEDKQAIDNVLSELEKKNKIIDLMSRAILNYDDQLVINKYRNKEEVKEYFEEITENEQFR